MPYIYRKQAKTFAENPLNATLFDDYEINISETGISTKGRSSESKFQWVCIVKKKEDNRFYYLFLDSQQAILLPKRSLKLKGDVEELEKLLSRYISFNADVGHIVKDEVALLLISLNIPAEYKNNC